MIFVSGLAGHTDEICGTLVTGPAYFLRLKRRAWTGLLLALLVGVSPAAAAQTQGRAGQPWGSWTGATVQLPSSAGHRSGGYAEAQVHTESIKKCGAQR